MHPARPVTASDPSAPNHSSSRTNTSRIGNDARRLTAIALLLRPMGEWYVRPAILALAMLALISPAALKRPWLWNALAVLIAVRIAGDWPLSDNHIYLLAYWCLAIGLASAAPLPAAALARGSRLLIGLAFAFAVIWKAVLAPDFLDGRFFRVTLLTDPRFEDAAVLIGGLSRDQIRANREALAAVAEGAVPIEPPAIVETPQLRRLASVSTFGILFLESAVSIVMLLPTVSADARASSPLAAVVLCGDVRVRPGGGVWLVTARDGARPVPGRVDAASRDLHRHVPAGAVLFRSTVGGAPGGCLRVSSPVIASTAASLQRPPARC